MKKLLLAFFLIVQFAVAQNTSTAVALFSQTYPDIPIMGLGHFMNNNWQAGSAYALIEGFSYFNYQKLKKIKFEKDTLTLPLKASENIIYRHSNWRTDYSPRQYAEFNKQSMYKYIFYATQKIDFFESYRSYRRTETHTVPLTDYSLGMLALSPLQLQYFQDPDFFLPILGASLFGSSLFSRGDNPNILEIKSATWFGKERKPFKYATANLLYQWWTMTLIAVSEEVIFRGIIQTELSEQVNPDFGLVASSILFGLMHYTYGKDWKYTARATAGGFYMGWQYQKYDYDLRRTIAFHFYIDFMPGFIETLINPIQSMNTYSVIRK